MEVAMKTQLQGVIAVLLLASALPALCQQTDQTTQTTESAQQWRAKATASKCITYDPNDWQYYPLNFQAADARTQAQPNGTDRVRPKC
jgi:hypothetical protein